MSGAETAGAVLAGLILYATVAGGVWRFIRPPTLEGPCACTPGWPDLCGYHDRRQHLLLCAAVWPIAFVLWTIRWAVTAFVVAPFRLAAGEIRTPSDAPGGET